MSEESKIVVGDYYLMKSTKVTLDNGNGDFSPVATLGELVACYKAHRDQPVENGPGVEQLVAENERQRERIADVGLQLAAAEEDIAHLAQAMEDLKAAAPAELVAENERLRQKVMGLEVEGARENDRLRQGVIDLEAENERLRYRVDELRAELTDAEAEAENERLRANPDAKAPKLGVEYERLRQRISGLEAENERLHDRLRDLVAENRQFRQRIIDLEAENGQFCQTIAGLRAENQRLQDEADKICAERDRLRGRCLARIVELRNQLDTSPPAPVGGLGGEYDRLRTENERLRKEVAEVRAQNEAFGNGLNELLINNAELRRSMTRHTFTAPPGAKVTIEMPHA